jgi:hypothetical protein
VPPQNTQNGEAVPNLRYHRMKSVAAFSTALALACSSDPAPAGSPPITTSVPQADAGVSDGESASDGGGTVDPGRWAVRWTKKQEALPTFVWENNIAYDPERNQVVQHGGHIWGSYAQSSYTYLYDVPTNMMRLSLAPVRPQRRCLVDMTYLPILGGRVLSAQGGSSHGSIPQGRLSADLRSIELGDPRGPWLYDSKNDEWEDVRLSEGSDWNRLPHRQLAFDRVHDAVVSLGQDGVALYSPRANKLIYRPLPDALRGRRGYGIAADDRTGQVVLFGGASPPGWSVGQAGSYEASVRNDTWVYDVGTDRWTELRAQVRPPRGMPYIDYLKLNLVFHPQTGRFLLMTTPLDRSVATFNEWPDAELWSLQVRGEEAQWEHIAVEGESRPAFAGLAAFATREDRLLLFGGGRDHKDRDPRPAVSRELWSAQVLFPRANTRPSLPAEPEITYRSGRLTLEWQSTAPHDVYRAATAPFGDVYQRIASAQLRSFEDLGAKSGGTYAYRIVPAGESLEQASAPVFNQPGRPKGLSAAAESPTKVILAWSAQTDAVRYRVFRSDGKATVELGATTAPRYEDDGLDLRDGVIRTYWVVAINPAGVASGRSPVAYTTPDAPAAFKATMASGKIELSWTASVGANRYAIYMNDHHENTLDYDAGKLAAWYAQWQVVTSASLAATRFSFTPPEPSKQYYFYARALNVMGQPGFFTDIVSATDMRFMSAAR